MDTAQSFNKYVQKTVVENWNQDALTDYKGQTLQFHDVARKIEKLHILFENSNVKCGDKIAICGRNSAHWAVAFMATLTYGAIVVPILHEFHAEQIHNIVNHSEAKLLFVGDYAAKEVVADAIPHVEGIVFLPDFSLLCCRSEQLEYAREHLNMMFGSKYPKAFRPEHVNYHTDQPENLAMINYTSGTTGFSKGVMLPYRAIWGNLDICMEVIGPHIPVGANMLSILPMAHMYGMAIEFIFPFCHGCHIYFLNRLPSPAVIAQAFTDVKPAIVVAVPLVVEKIIRKRVFPLVQNNRMKLLLQMPVISKKVREKICEQVHAAFGGKAYEVIVGGAALNQEVEAFLKSIDFPITTGYGTTECAPLITYSDYHDFVPTSCGTPVKGMEVKILSKDPASIPGEIVTRGRNVMQGYYKDQKTTEAVLDADGWYHTGDLATMSEDGHVFIRGRIKNMLLGANGQNIYPEEIEDRLNSMPMVAESLIVQQDDRLVAIVHPDKDEMVAFSKEELEAIMAQNLQQLNQQLPGYSRIAAIRLREEEFQKTPKKSIKRYLYKD